MPIQDLFTQIKARECLNKIQDKISDKFQHLIQARRALGKEAKIGVAPEGIQVSGMHFMEQMGEKIREALGPVSEVAINQVRSITALIQEPLKEELPLLAAKFATYRKGFGEFNNKYIKMPFEHILGIEFIFDKKGIVKNISGFHHDFMGMLEKSGLVEFRNKVISKFGEYGADLFVNGKKIATKTFFPKEWTREQVVEKIFEAYDNYLSRIASAEITPILLKDGKYYVETYTSKGMKILMHLTGNGKITSAYPTLL